MKLSRASIYGLLATLQLSDDPSSPPLPCSSLHRVGAMPEGFLLQVMRALVTHGICTSVRGVGGGYRLAVPLKSLTLLEIVEACDGPLREAMEEPPGLVPESVDLLRTALQHAVAAKRAALAAVPLDKLHLAGANASV